MVVSANIPPLKFMLLVSVAVLMVMSVGSSRSVPTSPAGDRKSAKP